MKLIILTYAKDNFDVASIDRLTEEAALRGIEVQRMRYEDCLLTVTNGKPQVYYRNKLVEGYDAVLPWIIQGNFHYGIEVINHFEAQGLVVFNNAEAFRNTCDKWRSARLFAMHGIATPDTSYARDYRYMHHHIDTMKQQPLVIKVTTGTRGQGVVLARDAQTAKAITGTLGICQDHYVVQNFIEESHGTDIRVYVVNGEVVAAIERTSQKDFRSNLSLGGVATKVHLTDDEKLLATRAAAALGLDSGGIDLIRSHAGTMVIEGNASGEFGIEKVTGANVAGAIINCIAERVNKK